MASKNSEQTDSPDWLRAQEQNSWQIELLISGGMIITLWQLPSFFLRQLNEINLIADYSTSTLNDILIVGLIMVSRALLIGFGFNLLFRTLWLTLLGVHFTFPKGIDFSRLNYSEYYQEKLADKKNTTQSILRIEKYCSLIFSLTIMIAVTTVGTLGLIWILYATIFDWVFPDDWINSPNIGISILFLFALTAFGLLDRIFIGWLKNKKSIQRWYYPFSTFLSYFNLTWIFKYEWLVILSNIKRWKVHLVTILFFLVTFIITLEDVGVTKIAANFDFDDRGFTEIITQKTINRDEYDNYLEPGVLIPEASIPSEIINQSFLPLFIVYRQYFDQAFQAIAQDKAIVNDWNKINTEQELYDNSKKFGALFNQCFEITIDQEKVEGLSWFYREHPVTKQIGFHTKIDIDSLARGEHLLFIRFLEPANESSEVNSYGIRRIFFWKE